MKTVDNTVSKVIDKEMVNVTTEVTSSFTVVNEDVTKVETEKSDINYEIKIEESHKISPQKVNQILEAINMILLR